MCKGTYIVELCNCCVRHATSYFNIWYDESSQHVSSVVIALNGTISSSMDRIIPIHIDYEFRETFVSVKKGHVCWPNRSTQTD
jgi:hypothetical protein